jgi:predicted metal-dependent hydrolase
MTPPGPGAPRRDRDPAGRPRNARPRDALGRPLPRDTPARDEQAEDRIPDDLLLPPAGALALAQRMLDSGKPFHAHEVLEASWKAAPQAERELWRGLAQVAVGLTHAQRGNARGAAALLRRGGQAVGGYATAAPYGIDAAGIARECARLAAQIAKDGATPVAAQALRLRLTQE